MTTFDLGQESIRGVLLDVEGTTTPVDFVYGTLFPYAREHLPAFLSANLAVPELRNDLDQLEREYREDRAAGTSVPDWDADSRVDSALAYLDWLMDRDRKSTALKSLQGKIWSAGYRDGTLRGVVFDDVAPALDRWTRAGTDVRIFSSGSVLAQKLLFEHSTAGDLTPYLSDYFDTKTGSKKAAESYLAIARAFGLPAASILFVSDSVEELDAAHAAGYRVVWSVRPGNTPIEEGHVSYPIVRTFDEITF